MAEATDPRELSDEQLIAEFQASDAEPEDPRQTALSDEIWRRNLDL